MYFLNSHTRFYPRETFLMKITEPNRSQIYYNRPAGTEHINWLLFSRRFFNNTQRTVNKLLLNVCRMLHIPLNQHSCSGLNHLRLINFSLFSVQSPGNLVEFSILSSLDFTLFVNHSKTSLFQADAGHWLLGCFETFDGSWLKFSKNLHEWTNASSFVNKSSANFRKFVKWKILLISCYASLFLRSHVHWVVHILYLFSLPLQDR